MRAATVAMIGGIALLVWWAYNRHVFDSILGLSIPHDDTSTMHAANVNVTLKRTPATAVTPYGPMFNPAGVVTSTAPTGPTFSPHYQDALARVHEPGGARDPFRGISDGLSWMAGARDDWARAEATASYPSLSEARTAWNAEERTTRSIARVNLNGDPTQNLNASLYDLATGEPANFAGGGSGRRRM